MQPITPLHPTAGHRQPLGEGGSHPPHDKTCLTVGTPAHQQGRLKCMHLQHQHVSTRLQCSTSGPMIPFFHMIAGVEKYPTPLNTAVTHPQQHMPSSSMSAQCTRICFRRQTIHRQDALRRERTGQRANSACTGRRLLTKGDRGPKLCFLQKALNTTCRTQHACRI